MNVQAPTCSETPSKHILRIRFRAGNPCTSCPTCNRPASMPYRRILAGKIVEGCIDAAHTPSMETQRLSNTGHWHFRTEAVALRRDALTFLKG
jgi:hypothetical protein